MVRQAVTDRIFIPDVLRDRPEATEAFLNALPPYPGSSLELDFSAVSWVQPFGVVLLVEACRHLATCAGGPVQLVGMRENVYRYLHRIDFFDRVGGAADVLHHFDTAGEWTRLAASSNVLELSSIATAGDVNAAASRARQILTHWLGPAYGEENAVVRLIAEACGNVVDHSHDIGTMMIQKYERPSHAEVWLAIGDGGLGIPRTLIAAHGHVATSDAGYIRKALEGLSARGIGRNSAGLDTIRRVAVGSGGSFYLRSGTGSLTATPSGLSVHDGLVAMPGTQIAIAFRSPRR